MSKTIKLTKGFDINLKGKAEKKLASNVNSETFAIKPSDFHGILRPKAIVNQGDKVKAGTPIFIDKKNDSIKITAPVSGEIAEIRRGEKRRILEIIILADKDQEYESFKKYSVSELQNLSKQEATETMLTSGVWPNLVQRPFGVIASPEETPKAIHISAFNSHPLAPDYDFLLKGEEQYFQAGVSVLKLFTSGPVNLNINNNAEISNLFSNTNGVTINKISGKHPAGNVGVQIHHIDPINKGDVVWTIDPYGVSQIGKLFLEGKYDASKKIALTGSEVSEPQYYDTYLGANVTSFIQDNLSNDHVRVIAGNVLTGTKIEKDGFVGYFDHQITVLPEGDHAEFLGWILPTTKKLSFHRAFGLLGNSSKEHVVDTNTNGEPRAFVQTGVFEKVTPMDVLPTHLLKAILAEDFDDMEALGIYEVIEEDLALCEFIDVSKHDVQEILREGLDLIQYS